MIKMTCFELLARTDELDFNKMAYEAKFTENTGMFTEHCFEIMKDYAKSNNIELIDIDDFNYDTTFWNWYIA